MKFLNEFNRGELIFSIHSLHNVNMYIKIRFSPIIVYIARAARRHALEVRWRTRWRVKEVVVDSLEFWLPHRGELT